MRDALKVVKDLPFERSTKFSITHRLLREDGFSHVIRCKNVTDKQFKVFCAYNNRENARLGIITSKKTLHNAVDRNRIKRVIRAVFRQHNIKSCKLDLVVMVRNINPVEGQMRREGLETLFSRIKNRCAEF